MAGPSWNRSRAAAVLATLLLHLVVGIWLLQAWTVLRIDPPPPLETELPPVRVAPISAPPLPMPLPEVATPARPDWTSTAREVAKGMTTAPTFQRFGETPKGPQERPQDAYPPPIFDEDLPRVRTTVTTT